MNTIVALLLAVGAMCNNVSDKDGCTKRVIQCTQDKGYLNLPSSTKQEQLLSYCSNKELGVKEKNNESSNP